MSTRSVALVTLGCTRNEVDSEELAGRLEAGGWTLVEDAADADVAVVNTCGFVESAKKDSIDALLEAADLKTTRARTRPSWRSAASPSATARSWPTSLPEADAVLGFDSYADLSAPAAAILDGERPRRTRPRDRRTLLPLSPADPPGAAGRRARATRRRRPDLPRRVAPASGPRVLRRRLDGGPWAPLKIASGCDRRCAFCAIPAFRGAFVSRRPADVLAEARWLAEQGVRELFLVSENSTSYGKDLGDLRLLETLLPELAAVDGIERVRVSYLQPAEMRPGLLEAIDRAPPASSPYFDLSFQHAAGPLLRRMRRFGDADALPGPARAGPCARAPLAGVRSQRDRRLPRRDRGRRRRARAVPDRRPARRRRRVRLLRRGRHRGRGATTASWPTTSSPSGWPG